jgi:hypothetical protein
MYIVKIVNNFKICTEKIIQCMLLRYEDSGHGMSVYE